MTHPGEDSILKFTLQLLDEPESASVQEHLSGCAQCRVFHEKALGDIARLRSIDFDINAPAPPPVLTRRIRRRPHVWRWAAALAAGFLLGYLTANLSAPHHPVPVGQHLVPTSEQGDSSGFVSCQAVDVTASVGGIR